ncbi:MAG TPA: sigma factor-like helix-turn-helix DNA-binding protein [Polyangiaceae bacterium]
MTEASRAEYVNRSLCIEKSLSVDQRRSRRKRAVRARTISVARTPKREIWALQGRNQATNQMMTRDQCADGPRPCPLVGCRYHLYLDVSPKTGAIKLNFPDLEVWELPISCALDVADAGGVKLEDVGALMNLTRERIRQIELRALSKLEALRDIQALRQVTVW